jgi:hypothetical protein
MRNFNIRLVEDAERPTLLLTDVDNNRHKIVEAPGLELAKLQAVCAIKQVIAREEAPMPECDECRGGMVRTGDGIELCGREECREWYGNAITILDRVEVTVSTHGDVGEVVL